MEIFGSIAGALGDTVRNSVDELINARFVDANFGYAKVGRVLAS